MASVGLLIIWKVISLIELETFYSWWTILNVKNLISFDIDYHFRRVVFKSFSVKPCITYNHYGRIVCLQKVTVMVNFLGYQLYHHFRRII